MGAISKGLVGVSLFSVFTFIITLLFNHELRLKNKEFERQLSEMEMYIIENHYNYDNMSIVIANNFDLSQEYINKNQEKISILDASIDTKNKRWALIKRVREVVEKYASPKMNIEDYTYVAGAIVDYAEVYDVPISLVLAVARRESAFNPKAKSHAGAMGIMQIIPATAADVAGEIGKRHYNLYNAKHNIQLGTYYLWKMTNRFSDDVELAVRAYNCGPRFVEKVVAKEYKNYPEETVLYHEFVIKYKKEFEELGL